MLYSVCTHVEFIVYSSLSYDFIKIGSNKNNNKRSKGYSTIYSSLLTLQSYYWVKKQEKIIRKLKWKMSCFILWRPLLGVHHRHRRRRSKQIYYRCSRHFEWHLHVLQGRVTADWPFDNGHDFHLANTKCIICGRLNKRWPNCLPNPCSWRQCPYVHIQ